MIIGNPRHQRFLLAFGTGVGLAGVSLIWDMAVTTRALIGVNGFFVAYLALMTRLAWPATPENLRSHASDDDEGIALILLLAVGAVAVSLWAIALVLSRPFDGVLSGGLALAAVPLGWAMVHTLAAFRYAHLYYAAGVTPGLRFADTEAPGIIEFLYLSFGVAVTAQVADVTVTNTPMRRTVLIHAIGAFFYNTIILALAVNAGLALGG